MSAPASYRPTPGLLRGRSILITGASRGIGRALALACAGLGAQLILLARNQQALALIADEIEADGGLPPLLQSIDLLGLGPTEAEQIADALREHAPVLHGLTHCAAVLGPRSPLQTYPPGAWRTVMQLNIDSLALLTQALLPLLMAAEDASIITVSSGVGRRGRAYWGAYAVSKFAVEGYTQILADELRQTGNVRVNAINPGATRTDMRAQAYPGEDPARLQPPEAILGSFLYLLGPDSIGTSGESIDCQ